MEAPSGWDENSRFIISELTRLSTGQDTLTKAVQELSLQMARFEGHTPWVSRIDDKVTSLAVDVAQLQVKAGIWGALAGVAAGLVLTHFKL